jgi:hypothetical protein
MARNVNLKLAKQFTHSKFIFWENRAPKATPRGVPQADPETTERSFYDSYRVLGFAALCLFLSGPIFRF